MIANVYGKRGSSINGLEKIQIASNQGRISLGSFLKWVRAAVWLER